MQHLERTHEGVSSPVASVGVAEVGTLGMGEDGKGTRSGVEAVGEVMEAGEGTDKSALMMKLRELEDDKAKAVGRFDGDIEALKRVLSFM